MVDKSKDERMLVKSESAGEVPIHVPKREDEERGDRVQRVMDHLITNPLEGTPEAEGDIQGNTINRELVEGQREFVEAFAENGITPPVGSVRLGDKEDEGEEDEDSK